MCTRDLSKEDCNTCLSSYIPQIKNLGNGHQQGGVLLGMSCYLRFEVYPFYNFSAINADTSPPVSSPPDAIVRTSPPVSSVPGKSNKTATVIAAIAIPAVAAVVLLPVTCFCLRKRWVNKKRAKKINAKHRPVVLDGRDEQELPDAESLLFDLVTLKEATDDFSEANKLGQGGFGPVYKGVLDDGQQIAVKRLSGNSSQGLIELKNEVFLVAKLQHRNLVRLLGCCLQEQERLLVYEYLPNTSLDKFLFDSVRRRQLDWRSRYKIIEGIARGLLYLHEDSRLKIIHRDLKASNILLDGDMNPKISDFGLAKLFDIDETQGNTSQIAGTYGYMPPEYVRQGVFSTKLDVYSYGVLVLEIVTGRKNSGFHASENAPDLLTYVWQHWTGGTPLDLKDQSLDGDDFRTEEMLRCVHIGLLCVHEDPTQRPSMTSIVLMLNSYSSSLPAPSPPTYYFPSYMMNRVQSMIDESSSQKSEKTVNDASITEMDPR
ncbi:putative receptor-like protein kinase At4g00960 [Dioscorea cayenensis subsp. rotundata]|uniref:Receptor-like protein kinase At4g00960 n=1 Tax=Dioscorea cayennensis subsp. rotundata TaxID=55577 RepID=A0AB40BUK1_DIOCR|nr:putative receptor-like protein kinase At4g00960 [Dioscorea cayenensis subsp. rotundata]